MRVWDIAPGRLCRAHLLGEHREIHAVWAVLTQDTKGYRHHPETIRWEGRLAALYARHELVVGEMGSRGYRHASPLDQRLASGKSVQDRFVDPPARQLELLRDKGCACDVKPSSDVPLSG